jgi:hypothetical protein
METITLPQPKAIPYQQDRKYGCPVYCLANLLNDDRILQELDEMKPTGMYSFWIYNLFKRHFDRHFNDSMIVEPLFYLPPEFGKLENMSIFDIKYASEEDRVKEGTDAVRVFLAGVHFGIHTKAHCIVLIQDFLNNLFFIVDPLQPNVISCPSEDLLKAFTIYQLDTFIFEHKESGVFFYRSYLSHLFE